MTSKPYFLNSIFKTTTPSPSPHHHHHINTTTSPPLHHHHITTTPSPPPQGYGLTPEQISSKVKLEYQDGKTYELSHGSVVIAAITSCTNTSNPSVMLGAGGWVGAFSGYCGGYSWGSDVAIGGCWVVRRCGVMEWWCDDGVEVRAWI